MIKCVRATRLNECKLHAGTACNAQGRLLCDMGLHVVRLSIFLPDMAGSRPCLLLSRQIYRCSSVLRASRARFRDFKVSVMENVQSATQAPTSSLKNACMHLMPCMASTPGSGHTHLSRTAEFPWRSLSRYLLIDELFAILGVQLRKHMQTSKRCRSDLFLSAWWVV